MWLSLSLLSRCNADGADNCHCSRWCCRLAVSGFTFLAVALVVAAAVVMLSLRVPLVLPPLMLSTAFQNPGSSTAAHVSDSPTKGRVVVTQPPFKLVFLKRASADRLLRNSFPTGTCAHANASVIGVVELNQPFLGK